MSKEELPQTSLTILSILISSRHDHSATSTETTTTDTNSTDSYLSSLFKKLSLIAGTAQDMTMPTLTLSGTAESTP